MRVRRAPAATASDREALAAVARIEEALALVVAALESVARRLTVIEEQTKPKPRAPRKPRAKPAPKPEPKTLPASLAVEDEEPGPSSEEEDVLAEFTRRFEELADGDDVPSIEVEEQLAREFAGRLPQFPAEEDSRETRRRRAGRVS